MEAVPRMSMLSLELKESAERVEFGPVIKPVSAVRSKDIDALV